ncbi:MAG: translation elongation factor Ts [Veillonellaceae bacterium]|nr:translation elongation factor Ts [Veillonellaceae bacterium]MDD6923661.1 translation elongation factor Ts [Veillonellaceae bacterium]
MAKITAAMVKELREKTGAGMMDCKKALTATDGDQEKAVDFLREKGIAKAEKKAGRIAAEGVVAVYRSDDGKVVSMVEVNCETDFVSATDNFHAVADKIAKQIADVDPKDLDDLNDSELDGKKVSDLVTETIASIGEKVAIRRFARYAVEDGQIASYIHMGGAIGVLVDLDGGDAQLGKDIAMQVAASNPDSIDSTGVSQEAIEREKEVARAKAIEEGKPEKILDRIVEGRIKKYYKEVCLVEQPFVKDDKKSVQDVLGNVKVRRFARFQLGEGIEKKQEDFAAEVAAQIK